MTKTKTTKPHPYAEIFALHEGQPLWDLSDRIKANGLREPIVTLDEMILDGRRRELACFRAQVEPRYRKFGSKKEDGKDPLEFVIDINLHRRHMGDGERKLAAARYATATDGKPRQLDAVSDTPTNSDAADKFEVSETDIDRAKTVLANGVPELQEALENDEVTISDAAKVAKEEPEVQKEAVKAKREGKAKSAASAAKKVKEEANGKNEEPEEPEPIADAVGVIVPVKVIPAFENAKEIGSLCREIDHLIAHVKEVGGKPGGEMMHTPSQVQTLQNVRKSIWQSKPTHVCPYCKGTKKSCDGCKTTGWTTKTFYEQAPENLRS